MTRWEEIKTNAARLALDFQHADLVISNSEFLRCIDILAEYIPDERISCNMPLGSFDFIQGWTDQILNATKKEPLAATAVITAMAHAYESIAKLPGSNYLIEEIPKHQTDGLFYQLLITYFFSKYLNVIAVEQDRYRVDIVAEVASKTLNIHVKGTDPRTKEQAQFIASNQLTQAGLSRPVINKQGESLEVVSFDGYIPNNIGQAFWDEVWRQITVNPVLCCEVKVPGGGHEPDSLLKLGLSWEKSRHSLRGRITGINAFQQAMNRINDINDKIPLDSQNIEVAALINQMATYLEVGSGVLAKRRLDGILAIAVCPGSLGYHFERSPINIKPKYKHVAEAISQVMPATVWLC